ncbi:epidermal growth factor-like protein 7 isoform X5 [Heterodontus francisci]|uniref:epidermal growth factor-like protein 7 isoform X5 n=1 Tax=Heterodontus francisci TaxID=7792 RepID=UPI00355C7885
MDRLFRNPSPSEGLLPVSFRRSEGADKVCNGDGSVPSKYSGCRWCTPNPTSSLYTNRTSHCVRAAGCAAPTAICDKPCENGGSCNSLHTCNCRPGWAGSTCSIDVNECRSRVQLCGQRCVNTPGSYRCKCLPGYTLNVDGRSCEKSAMTTSPSFTSPVSLPAGTKETVSTGLGNEVPELHSRLESLEQKMEWTLRTFENLILAASDQMHLDDPMSLENTQNLISHFQQLDRIESLSEQIAFLEERLDSCSCHDQN